MITNNKNNLKNLINNIINYIYFKKYIFTIILALAAIAVEFFYTICDSSCSYLKGNIFGIELQYIGISYMITIIIFSLFKGNTSLLFLLSSGFGIELYLIGFQIYYNTYCLYCLVFGTMLILQFLLFFNWKKKKLMISSIIYSIILFSIVFNGTITPSYI